MQQQPPDRFSDAAPTEQTAAAAAGDWTPTERDLLVRLWLAGRPLRAIAAALGRSPEAVRSRARRLRLAPRRARMAAASGGLRPCLCCAAPFPSDGPHHRLCDACRQADGADYRVVL